MTTTPHGDDARSEPAPGSPPRPAPEAGIDFDRPNAARIYDYLLGGGHNFAIDRELVHQMMAVHPDSAATMRANRAFLGRAVRWCAEQGIDQFLDLGSGVPTVGNVHEIAHQHDPASRVAYVDFEPVAVAHAEEIIAENGLGDTVTITRADLRDPEAVLAALGVVGLLDLDRPVGLLLVAALHFVPDRDDPAGVLARYCSSLAEGSVLVLSHLSDDHDDEDLAERMRSSVSVLQQGATPPLARSRAELRELLAEVEVVPPGLVDVVNWPDDTGAASGTYGAVGRVRPRA